MSSVYELAGRFGRDGFIEWVHGSAAEDEKLRRQHAEQMASLVHGGLLAAVVFSGYFALNGAAGLAVVLASLAFLSPLAIALYLSRTGRLDVAQLLTAAQLGLVVTVAAALSGGSQSFAVIWLILVPLEAALSASRRLMFGAAVLALTLLAGLHAATIYAMLPEPAALAVPLATLALVSHLAALLYAGLIVAAVQRMHRDAEQEIDRSRAEYQLIAEGTSDLVTRHDRDARITFASHAASALLGCGPERIVAEGIAVALPADQAAAFTAAVARAIETRERVAVELALDGENGSRRWLETVAQPLPGSGGALVATRDVTARKLVELQNAAAREAAEDASRAKSAFIATITHELRTPLNAIIGFSELLHRDLIIKAREPKHADYCRIIHESGEHLLSLVKDLLDVTKMEAGKLTICAEPFDLPSVVASSIETLKPAALARRQSIEVELGDGVGEMVADRRAVKQMLINLVSNACKFTGEGGRIRVKAAHCERTSMVRLEVADNGPGIALEHLARLGQPFFQVETSYSRRQEGAGLGLAIVRGLAELHGGRLEIASEVGVGSAFAIVLPLDAESAGEAVDGNIHQLSTPTPASQRPAAAKRRPAIAVAV